MSGAPYERRHDKLYYPDGCEAHVRPWIKLAVELDERLGPVDLVPRLPSWVDDAPIPVIRSSSSDV